MGPCGKKNAKKRTDARVARGKKAGPKKRMVADRDGKKKHKKKGLGARNKKNRLKRRAAGGNTQTFNLKGDTTIHRRFI